MYTRWMYSSTPSTRMISSSNGVAGLPFHRATENGMCSSRPPVLTSSGSDASVMAAAPARRQTVTIVALINMRLHRLLRLRPQRASKLQQTQHPVQPEQQDEGEHEQEPAG